jgi:nitrogen fixation NifU-like protein
MAVTEASHAAARDLDDLYQEVILDHGRRPRNFRVIPDADRQAEGLNPLCGDHFKLYVKLTGERIDDISFEGSGCAISRGARRCRSATAPCC